MESNSESNKENINSEFIKNKSSRMSILQFLDPLNPYPTVDNKLNCSNNEEIIESVPFSNDSQLNESWSMFSGFGNVEILDSKLEVVANATPFDICEVNALIEMDNNELDKTVDESQFLNRSVENNNVVVDNLLSLSPVKPVVDKSIHEQLKRRYITKRAAWVASENRYLEELDKLKIENEKQSLMLLEQEAKIELLTREKESAISEQKDQRIKLENELIEYRKEHALQMSNFVKEKDSIINDLVKENEENIENLQSKHSKLLDANQTEFNRISKELLKLRIECLKLNSSMAHDKCLLDQYYDSLDEATSKYADNEIALYRDNAEMELFINECINKYQTSLGVIEKQKKNEEMLKDNIKKKDMRIALLEKTQSNLNRELQFRISERDGYKDDLDKYLQ